MDDAALKNADKGEFGEGPCAFVLRAVDPKAYKAASTTSWFGGRVSWFDADALGWHLGFQ